MKVCYSTVLPLLPQVLTCIQIWTQKTLNKVGFVVVVVIVVVYYSFSPCLPFPVGFPKPLSPLLDIHVIIGDEPRLNAMVAGFEREVNAKGFTAWKSLDWFQNEL